MEAEEKKADIRAAGIYEQIACFLAEEHMLAPEEKARFLQCIREEYERCWQP